ncbi:fungal-specific transcription factor domain-containing protein [Mycena floridula]|nr:fungal-specific transcription factor domain-containing protein [Mycena floridula]
MPPQTSKPKLLKAKPERACDACRRRKAKCDNPKSASEPEGTKRKKCSSCFAREIPCTFLKDEWQETRRATPKAYVTGLEERLATLEALLRKLRPDTDYTEFLGPPVTIEGLPKPDRTRKKRETSSTKQDPIGDPIGVQHSVGRQRKVWSTHLQETYSSDPSVEEEEEAVGKKRPFGGTKRHISPSFSETTSRTVRSMYSTTIPAALDFRGKRPEFWRINKWEEEWCQGHSPASIRIPPEHFPPLELADDLFVLYFDRTNITFPLLHRASVMHDWKQGLQHRQPWFGCLCLAIFAMASRWSTDPRVLPKDEPDARWSSAGLSYFCSAFSIVSPTSLCSNSSVYGMQAILLMAFFLFGTKACPTSWLLVNVALRQCIHLRRNQKSTYSAEPNMEDELWKRTFWMLVATDYLLSSALGRSPGIREDDFDIDLPAEVNDDYWEAGDIVKAFCEARGTRSKSALFNHWLRLNRITAFTLRTLYAPNPNDPLLKQFLNPSKVECVKRCAEATHTWLENTPKHNITNQREEQESAWLYSCYLLTKMLIYRPFIPHPSAKPNSSVFPALEICVDAARMAARVFSHQLTDHWNYAHMINLSQVACGILLLGIWDARSRERRKSNVNSFLVDTPQDLMADLQVFLRNLENFEARHEYITIILQQIYDSIPTEDLTEAQRQRQSKQQMKSDALTSHKRLHLETPADFSSKKSIPSSSAALSGPAFSRRQNYTLPPIFESMPSSSPGPEAPISDFRSPHGSESHDSSDEEMQDVQEMPGYDVPRWRSQYFDGDRDRTTTNESCIRESR